MGGSRIGWNLVGALAALLGVAVLVTWVLGSYFKFDIATTMSFWGADGWCTTPAQGLGAHCWGDYSAIRFISITDAPTPPEAVYPLSSRLLRIPFAIIDALWGFQASLLAFVAVSTACLLFPVVWAVRHVPWTFKWIVITVLGVATTPFLVAWDRGNVLNLAVPFLFLAAIGVVREIPWLASISIIVASSVKPQFALVAIALLAVRNWIPGLVALAGSGILVAAAFLVRGPDALNGLFGWLSTASRWSASQPLAVNWPENISFPKMIHLALHSGPWRDSAFVTSIPDSAYTYISGIVLFAVVVTLFICGRYVPRLALTAAFLVSACLALPLSYPYYLVTALPLAAILFRDGLIGRTDEGRFSRAAPIALTIALGLSLAPLTIPVGSDPTRPAASLVPLLSTGSWAIFLLLLVGWAIARARASRAALAD